jgi:hypothetical protein
MEMNVKSELEQARSRVAELEKKQREFDSLTNVQQVATLLHEKNCKDNHTDYCDWYYDKWPSDRGEHSARNRYSVKARRLLDLVGSVEEAQDIIEAIWGK